MIKTSCQSAGRKSFEVSRELFESKGERHTKNRKVKKIGVPRDKKTQQ